MKIVAKPNARKFTKERLQRHPGEWAIEDTRSDISFWQGEESVLVKNLNDGWLGWLPTKDIEVTNDGK